MSLGSHRCVQRRKADEDVVALADRAALLCPVIAQRRTHERVTLDDIGCGVRSIRKMRVRGVRGEMNVQSRHTPSGCFGKTIAGAAQPAMNL